MKTLQPTVIEAKAPREVLDVLGPTIEFLLPPAEVPTSYCVMIGSIPSGVSVPLHSHVDDESFYQLRGSVEVLMEHGDQLEWETVEQGGFVHIPGGTKHAWRNVAAEPAVQLLTVTARLGRFFHEIGRPIRPGTAPSAPTPEELQHFAAVAGRYSYWLGSPEENAAVGLTLPA
jgi:quercetin dioxygenase-like cupin family protein